MKKCFAMLTLALFALALLAQSKSPRLTTVTPETGKADVEFSAAGQNLTKEGVKELYLTNGKDDIKVQITVQKEDSIQFKVPATVSPGRYTLMVLSGDGKQFLEQPVKLTIE